jgi:Ca2+-binding EF-hand superfamily protein
MIKNLRTDGKSHRILRLPKELVDDNKEKFEEVFQGMDTNDNRTIDMQEFITYIENYQIKTSPKNSTIIISETPPQRKTSKGKKKAIDNSNSYSD